MRCSRCNIEVNEGYIYRGGFPYCSCGKRLRVTKSDIPNEKTAKSFVIDGIEYEEEL